MAAPKGNQFAKGSLTSGRPIEHNIPDIASKLVLWAEQDTSINLNGFCAQNKILPSYVTRWANEYEVFREAYEYAKACLGERRERLLNQDQLHVKAYDLNAKVYDHFLKQEARQEMEFEASLKQDTSTYTPEQAKALKGVLDAVSKYQDKTPSTNHQTTPLDPQRDSGSSK